LGALHLDSRNREVRNPDEVRSPLWGQPLITCRDSTFWHFQGQGIGVLCSEIPEIVKRDNNFGESTFRVSAVEGSRNSEGEVAKSRNPKF
jgi:hypothetical protein